jgi:glycosyltransferase involved in cell wall biosynthesis
MILPPVSIVIPVYNDQGYIAASIESVLDQDYPDLELIVVDDGSTDGTPGIVDRYADACRIIHQANRGQSAALDAGWTTARGSLIGYLSSDDLLRRGAISTLVSVLESDPAVLAYPDFGVIDAAGVLRNINMVPEYSASTLYAQLRCLPGPGALFRRWAYERAGPWRRDLRQIPDLEFYLRLGLEGEFVRVPKVLADFRLHAGSTTYRPVPPQRADEPIRAVQGLLASELPPHIASLDQQMLARAHYLTGLLHGQSGRRSRGLHHLLQAVRVHPPALASRSAWSCLATIIRGAPRL